MPIVAKDSGEGELGGPPTGIFPALCIDVVDLGYQEGPYGVKHQIKLVWQLAQKDSDGEDITRDDGKPWRLSKYYNLSLNEKANLRLDLESWRGKPFTEAELQDGFDVENLLSKPCQLQLFEKRRARDGKTFVAVKAVLPKDKRAPTITRFPEYIRELEREGGDDIRSPHSGTAAQQRQAQQQQQQQQAAQQPAAAAAATTKPWEQNEVDDDLDPLPF